MSELPKIEMQLLPVVGGRAFLTLNEAKIAGLLAILPDGIGSRQEAAHAIVTEADAIIAILTAKPGVAPAPKRKYTRKVKPVAAECASQPTRFPRTEKHVEAGGTDA